MKITLHTLVKNEARFIWYSVMSVIKYVDRARIWDTGSTDGTIEIIEEIAKTKEASQKEIFDFRKINLEKFEEEEIRQKMLEADSGVFGYLREKRLEATTADWFIVVDADEIWWEDSIKMLTELIRTKGEKFESIVVPTINLVGDMFHYQEKAAGRYHLAGKIGHYNLRAVNRRIPGLHSKGRHGVWGWADGEGKMIQDRERSKTLYLDTPYLHATHLPRAGRMVLAKEVWKRPKKLKYEVGQEFPRDFYYPEVFFRPRPAAVPYPWEIPTLRFKFRAFLETPLRKTYRRTFLRFKKHGY